MAYYHAKDLGVSIGSVICGAQSFTVTNGTPATPIFQLGSLESCGIMVSPDRWTASLTVSGDVAAVTGDWTNIIADNTLTVACPLFGISSAACTGATFTGRAGSQPTATYTFAGTGFTTGGGAAVGTCGCSVATADISGPTAAYNITASCTVSYLEEFGSSSIVAVVASNPIVRATFEYYESAGAATAVTIGDMTVTLNDALSLGSGGRGSVGGFATISASYIGGNDGNATGGLTIA